MRADAREGPSPLRGSPKRRGGGDVIDLFTESRCSVDPVQMLTPRERQVAVAVAAGMTNTQAAAALSIAGKTVECHLGRIYAKLGIASRVQLAAVSAGTGRPVNPSQMWSLLTARERLVAAAVGVGMTNRQAATSLHLSPKTVEYHLGRVYRKLGIISRRQLPAIVARPAAPVQRQPA
jgi:DNA-binding CsgD family transcriptional regulator